MATAGETIGVKEPLLTSSSSSKTTNVATPRFDHVTHKAGLQQSYHPLQTTGSAAATTAAVFSVNPRPVQVTTGSAAATTAVVFSVNPRPVQVTVNQKESNESESETRSSQIRTAQSSKSLLQKTLEQSQPAEQTKSSTGVAFQTQLPSQTNSSFERIRQNQEKLLQQTRLLQERQQQQQLQRIPKSSTPPVPHLQTPTETTVSLLQQLQLRQQIQQQQHYQRVVNQQQKPQEPHIPRPSSQVRQDQVLTSGSRQTDPSSAQKQQLQQNSHSFVPSSSQGYTSQQRTHSSSASQNPAFSLGQLTLSHSQQKATSNPAPSLASSNARNLSNIPRLHGSTFVNSAGKSQNSGLPPSITPKQGSLGNVGNARSNSLVHEHLNNLTGHSRNNHLSSSLPATNGGQQSEISKRQEAVSTVNVTANGSYRGESDFPSEYQHSRQLQNPASIQNHVTTDREGSLVPKEVPTSAASNKKQPQPDAQSSRQSILVSARQKHIDEDVLPSGYRFSLPSPEYLLHRQRLQQQQQQLQSRNQPPNPQTSQGSQTQSLQSTISTDGVPLSGGLRREPARVVYTRQPSSTEMQTIQMQTVPQEAVLNQDSRSEGVPKSGYRPIRPSPEQWLQQKNHQELEFQPRRQPQPARAIQEQQQSLQSQQRLNASEIGNHRITLQSLYRPPIQSPGISSSAPPNDKHPRDAQRTSVPHSATLSHPSNTNPLAVNQTNLQKPLPKPSASIAVMSSGIVLSWNMEYDEESMKIDNYELFACQDVTETNGQPIKWKKIGIVKALPLPMACTLTQFSTGSKYFFSVRAVDETERAGPFSDPCTVALNS